MKYIKIFEGWFKKKDEPLIKSDYTYSKMGKSKIDPSKEIKLDGYMKCPKCRTEMKELNHGEIGRCSKCKTQLQVFGNALYVDNIDRSVSHFQPPDLGYEYTKNYTKEKLRVSDYERGSLMYCPLCHKIINKIYHSGECECGLKMRVSGNALYCEIDNEKLEFYTNLKKYNL